MPTVLRALILMLVCMSTSQAQGGATPPDGGAWWSYRDAYRALVRFDKLGSPKHLIQQRVQVQPRTPGAAIDALRLTLQGARTAVELPLDAALHTQVPLLKSAFDDNAVLRLNRPADAFAFRVRVSITPRADGLYAVSELRAACAQVLEAQQRMDPDRYRGKRCVGVTLAFARESTPAVALRQGEATRPLSSAPGALYPGESDREHAVLPLRWDRVPEGAQVLSAAVPVVIAAWID